MFGLWTGTAEAAAAKANVFIWLVTAAVFLISVLVPYLMLRRSKTRFRIIIAFPAGFFVAFAAMLVAVLYVEEIEKVPPLVSGRLYGGAWGALIGPFIGIWWAKRTREKAVSNQREYF